jgi:2-oxoisovalerate dehydrogenase E1 component
MGSYVLLTAFLVQRGSPEARPVPQDGRPVRRGGCGRRTRHSPSPSPRPTTSTDRAPGWHAWRVTTPQELDEHFRAAVGLLTSPRLTPKELAASKAASPVREATTLTGALALDLFDAQLASRHVDLAARWLGSIGEGFYTIGSSGHEGNAALAAAVRPTDPALLHYRSGGFYCARAGQVNGGTDATVGGSDPIRDILRGCVAAATEPIAGGRHKVFGHPAFAIIPTTSTIASHLPRAVGLGYAIEQGPRARAARAEPAVADVRGAASDVRGAPSDARGAPSDARRAPPKALRYPADAIVVCSFGDASINHATAQSALNTAGWIDHSGLKLPVLFVCEDNGIGISVRSPKGWVEALLRSRPGLRYRAADGCDLLSTYDAAAETADWVRRSRRPAVLHLSTVRLMGHAGADAEMAYRSAAEIAADVARDPLVATATLLVGAGLLTPQEVLARYDAAGRLVRRVAEEVMAEPKLTGSAEVVAPLAPRRPILVARAVANAAIAAAGPAHGARGEAYGGRLPEKAGPLTLAQTINATLTDALISNPATVLFGEDVAAKGGVYGVTKGLRDRFGARRVFDTLVDETSILGLALGAGLAGLLPVPEVQYLAYLHNAEDQLRGEAASMQFFSKGAYRNPMVVRVAGLAYQKGFGGHFHNDNSVAVLRDIPGLILAVPSCAAEAAPLLRTCLAAAEVDGSVCVFLEPIALYHSRDLHGDGDNGWLAPYAAPDEWARDHINVGSARVLGEGNHLTIITFGNGVRMSVRVAARLAAHGIGARVVDLRWLAPLPVADIIREACATDRVLVVDETRRSGGVGEAVLAALVDAGFEGVARRAASADSYIPLGNAAGLLLVSEEAVEEGARSLLRG